MTLASVFAEAASETSIGALVVSGVSILLLGIGALILDALRRGWNASAATIEATNRAVHTRGGDAVGDAVEKLRVEMADRFEANEARLSDQGRRLSITESSAAAAHRRIDQLDDDVRQVRRDHGARLAALEQVHPPLPPGV